MVPLPDSGLALVQTARRPAPWRDGRVLLAGGYLLLLPTILYRWGRAGLAPVFVWCEVAWLLLIVWPSIRPTPIMQVDPGAVTG